MGSHKQKLFRCLGQLQLLETEKRLARSKETQCSPYAGSHISTVTSGEYLSAAEYRRCRSRAERARYFRPSLPMKKSLQDFPSHKIFCICTIKINCFFLKITKSKHETKTSSMGVIIRIVTPKLGVLVTLFGF